MIGRRTRWAPSPLRGEGADRARGTSEIEPLYQAARVLVQSTVMPTARTILPQLAISPLKYATVSASFFTIGSNPIALSRCSTSASFMTWLISALSLLTIASGVLAGAKNATHDPE